MANLHRRQPKPQATYLYHGTYSPTIKSVKQIGLTSENICRQNYPCVRGIYADEDPVEAASYASGALSSNATIETGYDAVWREDLSPEQEAILEARLADWLKEKEAIVLRFPSVLTEDCRRDVAGTVWVLRDCTIQAKDIDVCVIPKEGVGRDRTTGVPDFDLDT